MLLLTDDEVREVTGYKRPADQIRWLRDGGWLFEVARGRPKVLRSYVEERMGGTKAVREWAPDFSGLGVG